MNSGLAFLRPNLACALALITLGTPRAEAAYDVFIKFGAPANGAVAYVGESPDPQFPGRNGWSKVISVTHGILNPTTIGSGGGAGAGQTEFADFSLLKMVDRGSPAIFETCARGGVYHAVQLVFRQQGPGAPGTPPFSMAKLELAFITGVQTSGTQGSDRPIEQVTIAYGALQWTHRTEEAGGGFDSTTVHWDVVHNQGGAGPLPGITLSPTSLPGGVVGTAYYQSFSATGGAGPYTYQLSAGTLPNGLTLSSAGVLSGTPNVMGSFTFKIMAMDDNACFAERSYTMAITDACGAPPRLTGITATNATVRFRLEGTVGCKYQIQSAAVITGPWSAIGASITIPANGTVEFTDVTVPSRRFYRAVTPP